MRVLRLCLGLMILVGSLGLMPAYAQDLTAPSFEEGECPFPVGEEVEIICGYLSVPEDRTDPAPDSPMIRLAVAILKAADENPEPDALIYLDGGPGGNSLESWGTAVELVFAPIAGNRDVILLDQRGVGYSEPVLDCPEAQSELLNLLDESVPDAETVNRNNAALFACRKRLLEESNPNLTAYNSFESAADVNDLRIALGYEQLNLLGISYGTRLALEVMRNYPEGVRSVILDSVVPPQADMNSEFIGNAAGAFGELFAGCAADAACNEAYPNLEDMLYETARALDENPAEFEMQVDGETYPVLFMGDDLFLLIFQALYSTGFIPILPQMIYQVSQGEYELAAAIGGIYLSDRFSEGMYFSVNCNEDYAFSDVDAVAASYAAEPKISEFLATEDLVYELDYVNFCQTWGAGTADESQIEPVTSDIPTLVLGGQYDPITPPKLAQMAAETLTNATYFEIPYAGHGPGLDGGCPTDIVTAFIADPSTPPDGSCLEEMFVEFATPLTSVTLTDFTNEELGISGVTVQDWYEVQPGIFNRYITSTAPFMGYRVPDDGLEGYVSRIIIGAYGYEELPEPINTVETELTTWNIYDIVGQGVVAYFAFTEVEDQGYVIVVAGNDEAERELLYEEALLPALEAFEVSE